jgi:hypothetical protein
MLHLSRSTCTTRPPTPHRPPLLAGFETILHLKPAHMSAEQALLAQQVAALMTSMQRKLQLVERRLARVQVGGCGWVQGVTAAQRAVYPNALVRARHGMACWQQRFGFPSRTRLGLGAGLHGAPCCCSHAEALPPEALNRQFSGLPLPTADGRVRHASNTCVHLRRGSATVHCQHTAHMPAAAHLAPRHSSALLLLPLLPAGTCQQAAVKQPCTWRQPACTCWRVTNACNKRAACPHHPQPTHTTTSDSEVFEKIRVLLITHHHHHHHHQRATASGPCSSGRRACGLGKDVGNRRTFSSSSASQVGHTTPQSCCVPGVRHT